VRQAHPVKKRTRRSREIPDQNRGHRQDSLDRGAPGDQGPFLGDHGAGHSGGREQEEGERAHEPAGAPLVEEEHVEDEQRREDHHGDLGQEREGEERERARVRGPSSPAEKAEVEEERGEHERRGEEVLSFGHPGHRLDLDGVQGENERRQSGQRQVPGEAANQKERPEGVERVKGQVHRAKRERTQPEDGVVERVREDVQGRIVADVGPGERGLHVGRREPADVRVLRHVLGIVPDGHEAVAERGRVHGHGGDEDHGGPERRLSPLGRVALAGRVSRIGHFGDGLASLARTPGRR